MKNTGDPLAATSIAAGQCVTPSWRLPLQELVSGLKTKTLSISFEEFLEPKSRPPAVGNEESRSTPPGTPGSRPLSSGLLWEPKPPIASEQAINRLTDYLTWTGIPSEQGINRECDD